MLVRLTDSRTGVLAARDGPLLEPRVEPRVVGSSHSPAGSVRRRRWSICCALALHNPTSTHDSGYALPIWAFHTYGSQPASLEPPRRTYRASRSVVSNRVAAGSTCPSPGPKNAKPRSHDSQASQRRFRGVHDDCRTRVRCFATVPPTVVRLSASAPQNMGSTEPGNEFAACSDPLRRPPVAGTGPPTHPIRLSQVVSRRSVCALGHGC